MPVAHFGFARFPAEIYVLSVTLGREVEQPQINVFDDAAKRFDAMDQADDRTLAFAELRFGQRGARLR